MTFLNDVIRGIRSLLRSPSFAAVALASLSLSIGANTLIFSILDATLMKPLGYPSSDRLVVIRATPADEPDVDSSSVAAYFAIRRNVQSLENVGAFNGGRCGIKNLGADGAGFESERLSGQCFSPSLFELLGVVPARGRLFTDAEVQIGNVAPVMLLGYGLWQRRFGGRDDVVGKAVRFNDVPTTIIGVLPADFTMFRDPNFAQSRPTELDFVIPLELPPAIMENRRGGNTIVARLKPGVSADQAQGEIDRVLANLGADDAVRYGGLNVEVSTVREAAFGRYRASVLLLQAAVACVLLVGCANVAGLLLGRNLKRRSETAMRLALGAGRARVMRQLVAEAVPLSVAGGAIGILLAAGGLKLFAAVAPAHASQLGEVSLDLRVLAFTSVIVLATTVLFAMIPAAQALRVNLLDALQEGSRGSIGGARRQRARSLLVAGQITFAVVLLIGAGLLLKSLLHVVRADLGADAAGLVTFDFHLPDSDTATPLGIEPYRGFPLIEINAKPAVTVERVLERVARIPGVTAAAAASNPPLGGFAALLPFVVEGAELAAPANDDGLGSSAPSAAYTAVAGDYFGVMKIGLREGRVLDAGDTEGRAPVVVVNESLARRFFPNGSALGKGIRFAFLPNDVYREIVGVVADTAIGPLERDRTPAIYVPHRQQSSVWIGPARGLRSGMYFAVRTTEAIETFSRTLTSAVAEVEANTPVAELRPLDETLAEQMQDLKLAALIVGSFAVLAAVLAATGVYSAISLAVADRAREIAVRMVAGAAAKQIAGMVLRDMLWVVGIGLALGLAAAAALSRALEWALFGIASTDPATYALVALLFVVIAVVSCVVPTLKATRVDPTIALKAD
jgi:putative ABC transport system permease protein